MVVFSFSTAFMSLFFSYASHDLVGVVPSHATIARLSRLHPLNPRVHVNPPLFSARHGVPRNLLRIDWATQRSCYPGLNHDMILFLVLYDGNVPVVGYGAWGKPRGYTPSLPFPEHGVYGAWNVLHCKRASSKHLLRRTKSVNVSGPFLGSKLPGPAGPLDGPTIRSTRLLSWYRGACPLVDCRSSRPGRGKHSPCGGSFLVPVVGGLSSINS